MDPIMTPCAVARRIEKSERTVALYAIQGKLPCIVTTTGRRLFRQSDVDEFLKSQSEKPAPEAA